MASESNDRSDASSPRAAQETRVDPPHAVAHPAGTPEPSQVLALSQIEQFWASSQEAEPSGAEEANLAAETLSRQATDLADQLQTQLAELDRREAHLNSQEAEFETRVRNARLWLVERETELDDRQTKLDQSELALEGAPPDSERAQNASQLDDWAAELDRREQKLRLLQTEQEVAQTELLDKLNELEIQTALTQTKQEELVQAGLECEERQRDLDRREAEAYQQLERSTNEQVALKQQQEATDAASQELTSRQDELLEWEQRLGERASEIQWQRAELDRDIQAHKQELSELDEQEHRLRFREGEIQTALERFERLGVTERKMVELQQQAAEFDTRVRYLTDAESLLAEQQVDLADRQREIERQELAFENHITRERRKLQEDQDQFHTARVQREAQLKRDEAEIEQRHAALENMQEELRATQRDALELRLATEETWLQLQGALAPATLTRSITQVRARLADHFQLAAEDVAARRQEFESVRLELSEEHEQLLQRRDELQRWLDRRESDLEQQAARLIAREQELDSQQHRFELDEKKWHAERAEYRREIQQLLAHWSREKMSAA